LWGCKISGNLISGGKFQKFPERFATALESLFMNGNMHTTKPAHGSNRDTITTAITTILTHFATYATVEQ